MATGIRAWAVSWGADEAAAVPGHGVKGFSVRSRPPHEYRPETKKKAWTETRPRLHDRQRLARAADADQLLPQSTELKLKYHP
jgi:hypothetical protein